MDRHFGGESVAPRGEALRAQPRLVAEIDEHRIDRRRLGGDRGEQRQIAREAIGPGVTAVGKPIGLRSEIGAEILGAPVRPSRRALAPA